VLATNQQTTNAALITVIHEDDAARAVQALHTAFIRPDLTVARPKRPRKASLLSESLRVG
jgi:hypothetical protein